MKTPTVRLVALGRGRQTYGTRVLTAGEEFEMPRQYADLLVRLGKARLADDKPAFQFAPPSDKAEPETLEETPSRGDDIESLRAEARARGIAVDGRWGVARLQFELARRR